MNVEVMYNCPVAAYGPNHWELACKFAASLSAFPADYPHKFTVVSNGGNPDLKTEALFSPFDAQFLARVNLGKDIGSYFHAAMASSADLMVFLGGSSYVRGAGWLKRIAESFAKHGEGLYGSMMHSGHEAFGVAPHIRTSGFWMPPALLLQYPDKVTSDEQRYPFEHGPNCLTSWVIKQNLPTLAVTWQGEYRVADWPKIGNGFHQSDQSGLILGDRMSMPPFTAAP